MRSLIAGLSILLTSFLATPQARAQFTVPPGETHKWPAFDVDGGAAYGSDGLRWTYVGRVGAGLHLINRDRVATFTGGFEMLGSSHKAFGARAEIVNIENGLGAALGPTLSTHLDPGVNVGVSFSLLHVEGMFVFGDHSARAIVAFLRAPLGLLGYGIWGRRN